MYQIPIIFWELLFLTYVSRNTPISCGSGTVSINAYFLGKDLLTMEKCAEFGWESDLMNRFIHRSWGEGFVATIYVTHHVNVMGITTCLSWFELYYDFLSFFFFVGFGREDLGNESTVLNAAVNRSNGVCGVVMVSSIIPLPCWGVYNDSLLAS